MCENERNVSLLICDRSKQLTVNLLFDRLFMLDSFVCSQAISTPFPSLIRLKSSEIIFELLRYFRFTYIACNFYGEPTFFLFHPHSYSCLMLSNNDDKPWPMCAYDAWPSCGLMVCPL